MKRKVLSLMIIAALALAMCCVPAFAEGEDIKVYLDNKELSFDVAPIIVDDRVLVPMRVIFEALGAEVTWEGETKTAIAYDPETERVLAITIGSNIMLDGDGNKIILDVPARIESGRTLLPLRAVSEAFGCLVEWDGLEREVDIINEDLQYALDLTARQETVEAANAEELLNFIGTDKKIVLTGTLYNLSDEIKVNNPYVEKNAYDSGYKVKNVSNMMISGNGAEIVTDDILADVLSFDNCEFIELLNLKIGHTKSLPEYMCEGAVTRFDSCNNIYIADCYLYGCGAFGIYADNTKKINVTGGKIYDCSYTGIWLTHGSTAKVSKSEFCDSSHMSGFIRIDESKIRLTECFIHDIKCDSAFIETLTDTSDITIRDCTFSRISYVDFLSSNRVNLNMDNCRFADSIAVG
ncbi:MAG: right-handed parallel beta-helix repeat-containing protein [Clostridia bacterium]|nr:right-handed parallel beta-helix repeat-containing protein [Clostridia bacterium]